MLRPNCHGHAGLYQHCEVVQSITDGKDLVGLDVALLTVGVHTCPLGDPGGAHNKADLSVIRLRAPWQSAVEPLCESSKRLFRKYAAFTKILVQRPASGTLDPEVHPLSFSTALE